MPKTSNTQIAGEFTVVVDFQAGTGDPSRVFRSMAGLIESFQLADQELASVLGARMDPVVVLERVESGSIRSTLRTAIESVDDEGLAEGDIKKVVGRYFLRIKHKILEYLDNEPRQIDSGSLEVLQNELREEAAATKLRRIPHYPRVPRARLAKILHDFSEALEPLAGSDRALFESALETKLINKRFRLPEDIANDLNEASSIENTSEEILKVKKPDFIGSSMWEFRHDNRSFTARIENTDWLERFQTRKEILRPGDAIRAVLRSRVSYDEFGSVLATHYSVLEVRDVIPARTFFQSQLDDKMEREEGKE